MKCPLIQNRNSRGDIIEFGECMGAKCMVFRLAPADAQTCTKCFKTYTLTRTTACTCKGKLTLIPVMYCGMGGKP